MNRTPSVPTVADVARLAGVGAITVSRAVNGKGYVSEEKRKRIAEAVRQLGYRPNQAARILKGNRARTIGLIVPDLADSFFAKCAAAIEDYAAANGYMTSIVCSNRHRGLEEGEVAMLFSQNVAGLIVVPNFPSAYLQPFFAANIPVVSLDRPIQGGTADEVVVENSAGARTAVQHLIEHGHRRIACVGYDPETFAIERRIHGYTEAMVAARSKPEVFQDVATLDAALQLLRRWKKSQSRPTAIFSLNNVTTRHLLFALREFAFNVPSDMALIGFDDLELAALLPSPLTVVRQPAHNVGAQASRLLFDRIAAEPSSFGGFGVKMVLPVEFVIRGSCGCTLAPGEPA